MILHAGGDTFPLLREVSNLYVFMKDGKHYFANRIVYEIPIHRPYWRCLTVEQARRMMRK